jgi:hypothetical protein
MSACVASIQPFHSDPLDDELAALTLQLEELGLVSASGKGKYPINHPPDFEVAFSSFQAELEEHKIFLGDQMLAQSMGAAVHTDEAIIGDLTAQEIQSHADHRFVLQLSNDDPEIEALPHFVGAQAERNIEDWMSTVTGTMAAHSVVDFSDEETEAGPSLNYAQRQAVTIKKLTMKFHCIACTDRVPRANMVRAQCGHRYCGDCVKSLFMRSTKDEGLYPPKCCKQPIPLALVVRHLDAADLAIFQLAAVEFATQHRVYCSNLNCAIFIVPNNIESGLQRACCSACGTETCTTCMNGYHHSHDCPDDPSLRRTRELAVSLGWQTCQACKRVVQLRSGCNHMTCVLGNNYIWLQLTATDAFVAQSSAMSAVLNGKIAGARQLISTESKSEQRRL